MVSSSWGMVSTLWGMVSLLWRMASSLLNRAWSYRKVPLHLRSKTHEDEDGARHRHQLRAATRTSWDKRLRAQT